MRILVSAALLAAACSDNGKDGNDSGTNEVPIVATPYENLPIKFAFPWTDVSYEGKPVKYYIPDDPIAVLWPFHGNNGGFGTITQEEWLELYNALAPLGIGIVLNESLDRQEQNWDLSGDERTNPDFLRLSEVRDLLVSTTPMSEATPILAVGFSNGGAFVNRFATMAADSGWDMRGYVVHNASNFSGRLPAMFVSAENDPDNGGPEVVTAAAEQCTDATGVECPVVHGTEIPMDPRRFARLPAYSLNQSQKIFDELVDFGYIDEQGIRTIEGDLTNIDALMNDYSRMSSINSPTLPPTQIRVVWATHRFSAQHLQEEVAYLLGSLQ